MGGGFSQLFPCIKPLNRTSKNHHHQQPEDDVIFAASEPLDETLGHSFCYVRSSARFLSPAPSDRFLSPTHSLRFSPPHEPPAATAAASSSCSFLAPRTGGGLPETGFRSISGASVSANTSTPRTVLQLDGIYDDATESTALGLGGGFASTSSFCALPLQTVPRTGEPSGPIERGFFMSGPIERGALSGPLDANAASAGSEAGRVNFSAPLGGLYVKKRRRRGISGIRKAFNRNLSEKKRPWVVPVLNFVGRKEIPSSAIDGGESAEVKNELGGGGGGGDNVQWALGKAGEDRVHVVVSEEHGWLFVGIYDGFNGPDAPEFLMGSLYRAVFNELEGLFWDVEEGCPTTISGGEETTSVVVNNGEEEVGLGNNGDVVVATGIDSNLQQPLDKETVKRVTFQEGETETRRRKLYEFLAEEDPEDGLDLSGSQRFAFSVDDALRVNNAGSAVSRRWLLLSKLKQGLSKNKEGHSKSLIPWKFTAENKEKDELENRVEEEEGSRPINKRRKVGPVDHELVLRALSRALELTELGYLDMTDKFLDRNPELALMGSCLLAVLMRDEDVYVMNVGDSRAIVAQYEPIEVSSNVESKGRGNNGSSAEGITMEPAAAGEGASKEVKEAPQAMRLTALQLSTDHSTSIEEEVIRIKCEHPDDSQCILNDRVKGRLKVTRAFGAGFLKQPKWNDVLLEMFRNEYIGTAPYISCTPSLRHHKLCPRDQFLILSSDGLYQYFSNQEVVSDVESFMEKFPDGDPAQHLIEELLFRAAKKAGMDFHELLDIPQGDRRKYHDDVTVMVISLEGRIWKSSGKYL